MRLARRVEDDGCSAHRAQSRAGPNSLQEIPEGQSCEAADDTADVARQRKSENRLPHETDGPAREQHRGDGDQQALPEGEGEGPGGLEGSRSKLIWQIVMLARGEIV